MDVMIKYHLPWQCTATSPVGCRVDGVLLRQKVGLGWLGSM